MFGGIPRTSISRAAVECGREVNRRGWEVVAVRAMPCPSHLLTVRSVELGSLGSAKPGAIWVSNPLQSRNSHAKLQTTPRPSEINRHAVGTTSRRALSATQKASTDSRIRPLEIAVNPHRTQNGRNARSTTRRNLPKPGGVPPAATSGTPDREHPL